MAAGLHKLRLEKKEIQSRDFILKKEKDNAVPSVIRAVASSVPLPLTLRRVSTLFLIPIVQPFSIRKSLVTSPQLATPPCRHKRVN